MKTWGLLFIVALTPLSTWASSNAAWIVLIPGASSSGDQVYAPPFSVFNNNRYFGKYEDALTKDGYNFIVCPKTRDNDVRTIEQREDECASQISSLTRKDNLQRDVFIVGHSTGGLVARELAQDDRVKDRIKTILLFSTPNLGTIFADYVLDEEAQGVNPSSILANMEEWNATKKHYLPELRSIRTGYPTSTFTSQDVLDNPEISYLSISTSFQDALNYMNLTRMLIANQLQVKGLDKTQYGTANDGVVPLYSEVYAHYLGNLPISHVDGACSDLTSNGAGCLQAFKVVLPIMENEASNPAHL